MVTIFDSSSRVPTLLEIIYQPHTITLHTNNPVQKLTLGTLTGIIHNVLINKELKMLITILPTGFTYYNDFMSVNLSSMYIISVIGSAILKK